LTQDEFVKALEPWKQELVNEVFVHYQHGNDERGKQLFERWKERFTQFLQNHVPDEAERFKQSTHRGLIAVGSNEHPFDIFMRVSGEASLAFIDTLADSARKGRLSSFQENPSETIRVFDDLIKRFEAQEYGASAQEDFLTVKQQLERLRTTVGKIFGVDSQYLRDLTSVQFRYPRAKQRNAISYFNRDKAQTLTVLHKILDELRVTNPGVALPHNGTLLVAQDLQQSLAGFRRDHPVALKTAFIMMSFADTSAHREIASAIKQTLASVGVTGVRADGKDYHPDLYPNILTYMQGCGFGIAVFDQLAATPINPNVAFEVGYMLALNKRVCLLKDKTLPNLQADLIGKLYIAFDPQEIGTTIHTALSRWLTTHLT